MTPIYRYIWLNFVAVGSVKPAMATFGLRVISVPKAKKKPKKKAK